MRLYTNHIWNIYSTYYNLQEAIVDGSSDTLDKLVSGPSTDKITSDNIETINVMMLLESMGNELTDEVTESIDPAMDDEEDAARSLIRLGTDASQHRSRSNKRGSEKRTKRTKRRTKVDTAKEVGKDLSSIQFMVGDKVISF